VDFDTVEVRSSSLLVPTISFQTFVRFVTSRLRAGRFCADGTLIGGRLSVNGIVQVQLLGQDVEFIAISFAFGYARPYDPVA
jgi:hypothetical protein